jgi:hypothetical protein
VESLSAPSAESPYSVTWVWMIHRPDDPAFTPIVDRQWTRPYASPRAIADERLAFHLYPYERAGRLGEMSGLVCRVWRADDPDWSGEAHADDWPGVRDGLRLERRSTARRGRVA